MASSKSAKKSPKQAKEDLKKAVASYNLKIVKDNKAFDKLKPAEKRVFIAQDVLKQLDAKKIIANIGDWVATSTGDAIISTKAMNENRELKEVFDSMKSCKACALGGLFVCAVKINDRLKISEMQHVKTMSAANSVDKENDYYDDEDHSLNPESNEFRRIYLNDIEQYLGKFFSNDQLKLIELAFESGDGGYDSNGTPDEDDASNFFLDLTTECDGKSYALVDVEPEDRMRLIMQNIIANKGRFVPSKKPEVKMCFSTPGFKG